MKHRVKTKHLNRDTNSRKALFKGLVTSLIESGEIETTETKAKAVKGLVDRLIYKAQEGSINTRRLLARFFGRRDIVNQLVDEVAPAMKDRTSGFTRIVKLANRRGDNASMVKIELVQKIESTKPEYKEEKKAEVKSLKERSLSEGKETKAPIKKEKESVKKEVKAEKADKPKTTAKKAVKKAK